MPEKVIPLENLVSLQNVRDQESVDDLAASMRDHGHLVPIQVYPSANGKFIIKFGHRRFRAAQIVGLKALRAIVEEPPNSEASLIIQQVAENQVRKEMSYVERAACFQRLKDMGHTQTEIAAMFGTSDADVSLSLSVLEAPKKIQEAILDGRLKPSVIRPLLSQPAHIQEELADAAIGAKTARKIQDLVQTHKFKAGLADVEVSRTSNVPEDADPLEAIAMDALNSALISLKTVNQFGITHPVLKSQARPTVKDLLDQAERIRGLFEEE